MRSRTSMAQCLSLLLLLVATLAFTPLVPSVLAQADAEEKETKEKVQLPLVIVNAASLERLLGEVNFIFELAEHPEISELIAGTLESNVRDFKGVERTKPAGVMIYLAAGLAPRPEPVGFIPINNMDEFVQTVSEGPLNMTPVAEAEDLYEIAGPRGSVFAAKRGNYVFVARNEEALDREFPSPTTLTKTLSARYDLCASLQLNTVPEVVKTIFLDYLRASAETGLQQRDGESDASYRLRKANSAGSLQIVEYLTTQGEALTLGLDVSKETKSATLELRIEAKKDSDFAKFIKDIGGQRSHFSNVLNEKTPLTFSMSWMMDKNDRDRLTEVLAVAEKELAANFTEGEDGPVEASPARGLFEALEATVDKGHIDFFAQMLGEPPSKFALVGGMRVVDGGSMAASIGRILGKIRDNPNVAEIEMSVDSHLGVTFHRFRGTQVNQRDQRLYGESPSVYFGAGKDAVWFTVGGKDAIIRLKKVMDKVAKPIDRKEQRDPDAPFQFIFNASAWVAFAEANRENNDNPRPLADAAKEAFKDVPDSLKVDFRPTDNGGRLRFQVDEGFLRLLGISIARRINQRQNL